MCDLMSQCMESNRSSLCRILEHAVADAPLLGRGIDSSRLLKLLSCYRHAHRDDECVWERLWSRKWHYNAKERQFQFRDFIGPWPHHAVPIPEKIFFSAASSIAGIDPEPYYWASFNKLMETICSDSLPNNDTWDVWLTGTLATGSTKLLRAVKECLQKNQPAQPDYGKLAKRAWQGLIDASTSVAQFNASEWLLDVGSFAPHMIKALAEVAIEEGHVIQEPVLMEGFMRAVGSQITRLDVNLDSPLRATDLTRILVHAQNLEVLSASCWKCGPGRNSPQSGSFLSALADMSKLREVCLPGLSFTPGIFRELVAALKKRDLRFNNTLSKLYLHGLGEVPFDPKLFGELSPICIQYVEAPELESETLCS